MPNIRSVSSPALIIFASLALSILSSSPVISFRNSCASDTQQDKDWTLSRASAKKGSQLSIRLGLESGAEFPEWKVSFASPTCINSEKTGTAVPVEEFDMMGESRILGLIVSCWGWRCVDVT